MSTAIRSPTTSASSIPQIFGFSRELSISGGVECESEQIEGDQDAGEGFLAVSKVVFEIVSVGLQNVKGLVFDLPPSAAAGGQSGDGVGGDREIGSCFSAPSCGAI